MTSSRIYWGDTHHNIFVGHNTDVDVDRVCETARAHLDFLTAAYYTPFLRPYKPEANPPGKCGFLLESWKPGARLEREWAMVQDATRRHNEDGAFVTFPGYEWQGDAASGDHNVVYFAEGQPLYCVNTLTELYECLRQHEAIALPHHTAFRVGLRGKDRSVHDAKLPPFAEVYSNPGCSETDEELIGLRRNPHMGPGLGGGAYQDALLRGYHVGAICSGDNFGARTLTGTYGNGLIAVLAPELTRAALWEAFKARRVYGVTGDRIELDFTVNEAPMGSCITAGGSRRIRVRVKGLEAIDRIEILKGQRVIATHNHQGTWQRPQPGKTDRFCLRVETGWGPAADELEVGERVWDGELALTGGSFLRTAPCWRTHGQEPVQLLGKAARFRMRSDPEYAHDRWQNANVFEFEADPADELCLRLNGLQEKASIAELMAGSRVMWFRDECVAMLKELRGHVPEEAERDDAYYHMAYKAKLHRVMPSAAYTAEFDLEDDEPFTDEIHYRVRVEQRNGQRAWSSPVWVRPQPA